MSPYDLDKFSYDVILVTVTYGRSQVLRQLIQEIGISTDKILLWFEAGSLGENNYDMEIKLNDSSEPYTEFYVHDIDKIPIKFTLEESGEYMCFEEWFCMNEYRLDVERGFDVIDIGMNVGVAVLYYARQQNVYNVYGFEPFTKTYKKAARNINMNLEIKEKVEMFNIALSDHDSEEQYDYIDEYPGGMSLLNPQATDDSLRKSIIKVCEASRILEPIISKTIRNNRALLMKIDCEGSEYAILENLKQNHMINIPHYYIIETHAGRHNEAVDILRRNGYVVFSRAGSELGMIFASKDSK